jgi:hypothetical protein
MRLQKMQLKLIISTKRRSSSPRVSSCTKLLMLKCSSNVLTTCARKRQRRERSTKRDPNFPGLNRLQLPQVSLSRRSASLHQIRHRLATKFAQARTTTLSWEFRRQPQRTTLKRASKNEPSRCIQTRTRIPKPLKRSKRLMLRWRVSAIRKNDENMTRWAAPSALSSEKPAEAMVEEATTTTWAT